MTVSGFCFRLPFNVKIQMEKIFLPVDLTSKSMPCYWWTASLLPGIWLHMVVKQGGRAVSKRWRKSKPSAAVGEYGAMLTRAQEGKDPLHQPNLYSLFPSKGNLLEFPYKEMSSSICPRQQLAWFIACSAEESSLDHQLGTLKTFISHRYVNFES
jgi:hypothetical protein